MKNRHLGVGLCALALISASGAWASPCGHQALKMFKAYGLSETPSAGPIPPGSSGGDSRGTANPSGLSDGKQLSPIQQQALSLEVKQAIQADEAGDPMTCRAKVADVRAKIKLGK